MHETVERSKIRIGRERSRRELTGYAALCTVNEKLCKLLEDADSRLLSATQQYDESRASGNAHDAMADQIVALYDVCERLRTTQARIGEELDSLLELVECAIAEDPEAGSVLAMRYMESRRVLELGEIAELMGYSEQHVRRLHLRGLDAVARKMLQNAT